MDDMTMKNFFLSLKTTVWTLSVLVCIFFIGSYLMPVHREVFERMNEDILSAWVETTALGDLRYTWWFFAALAGLALLTVNAFICSIQAIKGKWTRSDFLLRISPQVIHAGFLFILLAHLLSAGWGYKTSGMMSEGAFARLPENRGLFLKAIHVQAGTSGSIANWSAEALIYENDVPVGGGILGPNKPIFYKGVGIYLEHLSFDSVPVAFLVVAKDPGAIWALCGAILFTVGSAALLAVKWKKAT